MGLANIHFESEGFILASCSAIIETLHIQKSDRINLPGLNRFAEDQKITNLPK